ncbi:ATP synthase subunit g [Sclerotinia borealis F-4128]|uniref:ATP synthase subunit g n=1 Tax=Sclerotinia borealis (strain F-4128) TaxID=1432307 RepID=W9C5N2_SCLBF|nr:ATP synthase subunit g [Sclerotinia borealis F-4128]
MSLHISRTVLRHSAKLPGRAARRFESTSTKASEAAKDTASKVSEKASEFQSKASEGLSRVSSTAGPAIAGAAKTIGNALGKVGGRTGRLIAFIERQIPPTVYYARVGLELSKLVIQGQKMSLPPASTFQSYFQRVVKGIQSGNPQSAFSSAANSSTATPTNLLEQIRSITTTQLVSGGVVFAEVLGFFTIGEMIGRMKLIGYRGDTGAHH